MGRKRIQKRGRPPKWLKEQEKQTPVADELLNNDTNNENEKIMEKSEEKTTVLTEEENTAIDNSGESFDPFADKVNEKQYQKANFKVKGNIPLEVPEADIKEPTIEIGGSQKDNTPPNQTNSASFTASAPPVSDISDLQPPKTINPIPKKDQQEGSRRLAETIVGLYCMGKEKGLPYLFDLEGRLNKWIKKGKISKDVLRMEVQDNEGNKQKLIDFVRENNDKIKEICQTSETDQEAMVEAWYKVLLKKGLGLSDEWNLVYLMLKDLLLTGIALQSAVVNIRSIAETLNSHVLVLNKQIDTQTIEIDRLKQELANANQKNSSNTQEDEKVTIRKGRPKKVKVEEMEEPEEKELVEQDEN